MRVYIGLQVRLHTQRVEFVQTKYRECIQFSTCIQLLD